MSRYYVLDDRGEPLPVDLKTWAIWFDCGIRRIGLDGFGLTTVSTVFLGLDHAWAGGPPVLWETCVFQAPDGHDHVRRYTSRAEAEEGHKEVLKEIRTLVAKKEHAP